MSQHHDPHEDITTTLPRISIPPYVPATPEELERRRQVIAEIDRIREQMEPIGIDAAELIDMDFFEIEDQSE
jgi:hypothetical protein